MSKTKLLIGDEVFKLINTSTFVTDWKKLALATSGFTRLQEPEFVIPWYDIYKKEYEPVMTMLLGNEDKPLAMMCLAWDKNNGTLTHAGEKNAEFHGWLAKKEIEPQFLAETITLVRQKFRLKKWSWGWIPPGFTYNPFKNLKVSGIYVHNELRPSLLWDLTNPEKLQKAKKNRSFKSKKNRLQKKGELKFRVITNEKELEEILYVAQYQCDFRQEAINDARPFGDNPKKIEFNATLLQSQGTIHASGLWLDDKLLAFHFGICDEKRVCLGTICYDPSESKHSPGTLLLVELAQNLTENGYEILDLTPGTDGYKERFANDSQELNRPSFYFSKKSITTGGIKHFLLDNLKRVLPFFRLDISLLINRVNTFKEFNKKAKRFGLLNIIQQSLKGIFLVEKKCIYQSKSPFKPLSLLETKTVQENAYEHLMNYTKFNPWQTRRDLLKVALDHFYQGESLFSFTKNNDLTWFCWLSQLQNHISIKGFSKKIELKQDGYVLQDFYCSNRDSFFQYLESSISQIKTDNLPLYLIINSSLIIPDDKKRIWNFNLTKKISSFQILWFFKFIRVKKYT